MPQAIRAVRHPERYGPRGMMHRGGAPGEYGPQIALEKVGLAYTVVAKLGEAYVRVCCGTF